MDTEDPKLQSAETDLKQLMADVTRAMEKAQRAIALGEALDAAKVPREKFVALKPGQVFEI